MYPFTFQELRNIKPGKRLIVTYAHDAEEAEFVRFEESEFAPEGEKLLVVRKYSKRSQKWSKPVRIFVSDVINVHM